MRITSNLHFYYVNVYDDKKGFSTYIISQNFELLPQLIVDAIVFNAEFRGNFIVGKCFQQQFHLVNMMDS